MLDLLFSNESQSFVTICTTTKRGLRQVPHLPHPDSTSVGKDNMKLLASLAQEESVSGIVL